MDLVDYKVAYVWAHIFVSDDFIELIHGSHLRNEQHNLAFPVFASAQIL